VALTVGLGYIPSVQFAQFYLADQAGYYRAAGLAVTLENKIDPDLITLLGQGAVDIGSGDGTSVIPAVSQGIPVVYTSTIYGQFPSIVIAKASSGITTAADLKGKKIGIPGKYGSSWIMLQALLKSANLTPDDVQIVLYPDFGQATALQQGAVDAATGFANNEPIALKQAGIDTVVLTVDSIVPLPGPGLVTGTATLASKHDALKAFTAATLRAMNEIVANPQLGMDATFKAVPALAQDPALQRLILDATVATWSNTRTGAPFGTIDRAGWQQSLDFMTSLGLVPNPVTVDQLVDASLLP
jgi:NitT/TauT family transport system substrate-binding protein